MDSESKLEQFILLSKGARGPALAKLIENVTGEAGIFSFGALLDVPSIRELEGSEFAQAYQLLLLFAYGTWSDYKACSDSLPALTDKQRLKLKQLSVVSAAGNSKVIPYADLMAALDIANIRELEDLLISECFYSGLVTGKLDQRRQCLRVADAASRDVRAVDLQPILDGLAAWSTAAKNVASTLEARARDATAAAEAAARSSAEAEAKVEEVRKALKAEAGGAGGSLAGGAQDAMQLDDALGPELMEEDRHERPERHNEHRMPGDRMERHGDRLGRPKRRR